MLVSSPVPSASSWNWVTTVMVWVLSSSCPAPGPYHPSFENSSFQVVPGPYLDFGG